MDKTQGNTAKRGKQESKPPNNNKKSSDSTSTPKCYKCKEEGHLFGRECPLWDENFHQKRVTGNSSKKSGTTCSCEIPPSSNNNIEDINYILSLTPNDNMIFSVDILLPNDSQVNVKFLLDSGSKRNYGNKKLLSLFQHKNLTIEPSNIHACSPIGGECTNILGSSTVNLSFLNELCKIKTISLKLNFFDLHCNSYDLIVGQTTIREGPLVLDFPLSFGIENYKVEPLKGSGQPSSSSYAPFVGPAVSPNHYMIQNLIERGCQVVGSNRLAPSTLHEGDDSYDKEPALSWNTIHKKVQ